jgi:adenosylcobinamide-GDP ribazoletransferase
MISALSLLTIVGRGRAPDASAMRWFPLVGVLVGAMVAAAHWGAHHWWSPLVAAGLVVTADLVVTGALHVDGTADSADGLLPHLDSEERRLEVMADPAVGTFGLVAVLTVLGLRWAAFTDPLLDPVVIVAVWAMSRTVVAVVPAVIAYARPGGLAAPFLAGARRLTALWLVPVTAVAVVAGDTAVVTVLAALGAGLLAAIGVVALAMRRIGGYTGDILGATIVVSETVALVVVVASP